MVFSREYDNEEWSRFAKELKKSTSEVRTDTNPYASLNAFLLQANQSAEYEPGLETVPQEAADYIADEMADAALNRLTAIADGSRRLNYFEPPAETAKSD
jgi:DNA polymerase III gamma/tau subunit